MEPMAFKGCTCTDRIRNPNIIGHGQGPEVGFSIPGLSEPRGVWRCYGIVSSGPAITSPNLQHPFRRPQRDDTG